MAKAQATIPGGGCEELLTRLLLALGGSDAPQRAAKLISAFGSLPAVLAARPEAIDRAVGPGSDLSAYLATVRAVLVHSLKTSALQGPLLPSSAELIDYLHISMAHAAEEEFRVLYLNSRNLLLRDERLASGTPNEVSIHPRMILKRALEIGATALILVHNHPSGSPEPSQGDIQTTARIVRAARTLDIVVHDHIIVARGGWRSFRQSGLLV
jgi:DNA repair protein RadC